MAGHRPSLSRPSWALLLAAPHLVAASDWLVKELANVASADSSDCFTHGHRLGPALAHGGHFYHISAAEDCQQRCAANDDCHFWSFYVEMHQCWLIGENPSKPINDKKFVSGPKVCSSSYVPAGQEPARAPAEIRVTTEPPARYTTPAPQAGARRIGYIENALTRNLCVDVRYGRFSRTMSFYDCEWDDPNTDQVWIFREDGLIENYNYRGLCLSMSSIHLPDPKTENFSPITLQECQTTWKVTDQKWAMRKDGKIENLYNPGKCIDVRGAPARHRFQPLQLWDCEDSRFVSDQFWMLQQKENSPMPHGVQQALAYAEAWVREHRTNHTGGECDCDDGFSKGHLNGSWACIRDVADATSVALGDQMCSAPAGKEYHEALPVGVGMNQLEVLADTLTTTPAPGMTKTVMGHSGFIENVLNPGKCIDVRANSKILQLYTCEFDKDDKHTDQRFVMRHDGFIESVQQPGKCIDIEGNPGVKDYFTAVLNWCEWDWKITDQRWIMRNDGLIENRLTPGKCLDVAGFPAMHRVQGKVIQLFECDTEPVTDQRWMIAQSKSDEPPQSVIDAQGGTAEEVRQKRTTVTTTRAHSVTPAPGQCYCDDETIVGTLAADNACYLQDGSMCSSPAGKEPARDGLDETPDVEDALAAEPELTTPAPNASSPDLCFLENVLNRGRCIDKIWKSNDVQMHTCEWDDPATDQRWKLRPDGFIESGKIPGHCLDVAGNPATHNGQRIRLAWCQTDWKVTDQKWMLRSDGMLENVRLRGKCIDAAGAPATWNNAELRIWDCDHAKHISDQRWICATRRGQHVPQSVLDSLTDEEASQADDAAEDSKHYCECQDGSMGRLGENGQGCYKDNEKCADVSVDDPETFGTTTLPAGSLATTEGPAETTALATETPTFEPTLAPTLIPTETPTFEPTVAPTLIPTETPTFEPTLAPTLIPTDTPTFEPTLAPTLIPTMTTLVTTTANRDISTLFPTTISPPVGECICLDGTSGTISASGDGCYKEGAKCKDFNVPTTPAPGESTTTVPLPPLPPGACYCSDASHGSVGSDSFGPACFKDGTVCGGLPPTTTEASSTSVAPGASTTSDILPPGACLCTDGSQGGIGANGEGCYKDADMCGAYPADSSTASPPSPAPGASTTSDILPPGACICTDGSQGGIGANGEGCYKDENMCGAFPSPSTTASRVIVTLFPTSQNPGTTNGPSTSTVPTTSESAETSTEPDEATTSAMPPPETSTEPGASTTTAMLPPGACVCTDGSQGGIGANGEGCYKSEDLCGPYPSPSSSTTASPSPDGSCVCADGSTGGLDADGVCRKDGSSCQAERPLPPGGCTCSDGTVGGISASNDGCYKDGSRCGDICTCTDGSYGGLDETKTGCYKGPEKCGSLVSTSSAAESPGGTTEEPPLPVTAAHLHLELLGVPFDDLSDEQKARMAPSVGKAIERELDLHANGDDNENGPIFHTSLDHTADHSFEVTDMLGNPLQAGINGNDSTWIFSPGNVNGHNPPATEQGSTIVNAMIRKTPGKGTFDMNSVVKRFNGIDFLGKVESASLLAIAPDKSPAEATQVLANLPTARKFGAGFGMAPPMMFAEDVNWNCTGEGKSANACQCDDKSCGTISDGACRGADGSVCAPFDVGTSLTADEAEKVNKDCTCSGKDYVEVRGVTNKNGYCTKLGVICDHQHWPWYYFALIALASMCIILALLACLYLSCSGKAPRKQKRQAGAIASTDSEEDSERLPFTAQARVPVSGMPGVATTSMIPIAATTAVPLTMYQAAAPSTVSYSAVPTSVRTGAALAPSTVVAAPGAASAALPQTVQWQVPEGAQPGQSFTIPGPDGRTFTYVLQAGMLPGQLIQVPLPQWYWVMQQQASQEQTIQWQVPSNAQVGQRYPITGPDGRIVYFTIQPGMVPGQLLQIPWATVGFDVNRDGRADYFVSGVDFNHSHVPDALEMGRSVLLGDQYVGQTQLAG